MRTMRVAVLRAGHTIDANSFLRSQRRRVVAMASAAPQLWALDFDGVVCDSVGESSLSAWKAASALWPDIFNTPDAQEQRDSIVEKMRAVRPVVETGYENIVQVRALFEGAGVDEMLDHWHDMLPGYMRAWGLDRAELVHLFGSTRDAWMAADLQGWLAPNRIYPGVAHAVRDLMADHEVYIVTTKQARFTEAILRQMAAIEFPPERIFSQTVSGQPKSEVLERLGALHPGMPCHFVEDKLSTLEKVAKLPQLSEWSLYLVDWGYNTAQEQDRAARSGRIRVIGPAEFSRLAGSTASQGT